jgi:hypothetical protein
MVFHLSLQSLIEDAGGQCLDQAVFPEQFILGDPIEVQLVDDVVKRVLLSFASLSHLLLLSLA